MVIFSGKDTRWLLTEKLSRNLSGEKMHSAKVKFSWNIWPSSNCNWRAIMAAGLVLAKFAHTMILRASFEATIKCWLMMKSLQSQPAVKYHIYVYGKFTCVSVLRGATNVPTSKDICHKIFLGVTDNDRARGLCTQCGWTNGSRLLYARYISCILSQITVEKYSNVNNIRI